MDGQLLEHFDEDEAENKLHGQIPSLHVVLLFGSFKNLRRIAEYQKRVTHIERGLNKRKEWWSHLRFVSPFCLCSLPGIHSIPWRSNQAKSVLKRDGRQCSATEPNELSS